MRPERKESRGARQKSPRTTKPLGAAEMRTTRDEVAPAAALGRVRTSVVAPHTTPRPAKTKLTVEIDAYVFIRSTSDHVAGGHWPATQPCSADFLFESASAPVIAPTVSPTAPTPNPT